MPIKYIISDWNRTLISYPDEGKLMERIGKDILKNSGILHPRRSVQLLKHMFHLKGMVGWYKAGGISYKEIYDYFNPHVLEGAPKSVVDEAVKKYAAEAAKEVDVKFLKAIWHRHSYDVRTGILSTGYKDGIIKTINHFGSPKLIFDKIVANRIIWQDDKTDTVAEKFHLKIYGNKEKYLESEFFIEAGFDPKTTSYWGDTDEDRLCLEAVGYPVVSHWATDDFKQRMASEFGDKLRIAEKPEDYKPILTLD